ncbi:hypothetical protein BH09SUM1_BH09SUM1_23610 [soil metagenome]
MSITVWTDSVEAIARQREAAGRDLGLPAAELVRRARLRAEAVRKAAGIAPARPIKTLRQWDAFWKATELEKALLAAFAKLGWSVTFVSPNQMSSQAIVMSSDQPEGNNLLLETTAAEIRMVQYAQGGLEIPLKWSDAALILMAEELYAIAAEKLGEMPKIEMVDEVARAVFVQEALGLPFSPWVLNLG